MFNIHKMSEIAQAIRRAVREAIQAGQTPGAVVLVGRGDEILFHEAFWLSDAAAGKAANVARHDF